MGLEDKDIAAAKSGGTGGSTGGTNKNGRPDFNIGKSKDPGYQGSIPLDRVMLHDYAGNPVTWRDIITDWPANSGYPINSNMSIDEWFEGAGGGSAHVDILGKVYMADPTNSQSEIDEIVGSGGGSGGSGGGGGGGSSSAVAPSYQAPPSGTVRDQIKSYVIATTGTANEAVIDSALSSYMASDKKAFDQRESSSAQIDPWQTMKDTVRGTAAYKAVNQGRPDSVDEMDWVSGMQGKLRSIGLSAEKAESLGISGAIAGNTDEALVDAAEMQQVQSTGRMLKSQRESLKQSAASVARLVV